MSSSMVTAIGGLEQMVSQWWTFVWTTDVPGTGFTFGALYIFLLLVSIFVSVFSIILGRKEDHK